MAVKKIKLKLQGHEKFPLREGWINKALMIIPKNPDIFLRKDATDMFGIGSNMVKSLRYWMKAFGLTVENRSSGAELTDIGKIIAYYDPYLENPFTLWIMHSYIAKNKNEAKRNNLLDLVPDTYYSIALERIADWEENYSDTYALFEREIMQSSVNMAGLKADLKMYSKNALNLFKSVYPKVTAGSEFNPMAVSEVLPLYKSTSEKLVEEYGYSGIYIVFDEFSKFIESQEGMAVGANMKLIQDICELATDSQNAQIFFTMVTHKSILLL